MILRWHWAGAMLQEIRFMSIDDFIASEAPHLLSLEEKARRRILQNPLRVEGIAQLWGGNKDEQEKLLKALCRAVVKDALASDYEKQTKEANWYNSYTRQAFPCSAIRENRFDSKDALVYREDFETYLRPKNQWPVKDCLLENWWTADVEGGREGETNNKNEFDKRLDVLKSWLISLGYSLDEGRIKLPKKYKPLNKIHIALNNHSADKSLFNIGLGTFETHFWKKQKIAELTRGRKPSI